MSFTAGAGTRFIVTSTASGTTVSGPFTITGGTATTNTPVLDATQTWNAGAVTFTGWRLNVTDTASAAGSLLMDLQKGGVSQFKVDKSGNVTINNSNATILGTGTGYLWLHDGVVSFGGSGSTTTGLSVNTTSSVLKSDAHIGWSPTFSFQAADIRLFRDAANTLAQRNGVNAQTFNLYGTYTDGSNYRRVAIAMTAAGVASIAPAGLGTGASGNVLHISGLPTANPGPGILWNDAGTVKVGT